MCSILCLRISSDGPTPDLNNICGEPNAPELRITSLVAFTETNSPASFKHSTPTAFLFSKIILFTLVSVITVKFSLFNEGTRYAFAALQRLPSF